MMNTFVGINAYKNVGLETSVMSADPHKLVAMLFQGALLAISEAKYEMQNRHIEAKGKAISKAIAIIGEGLQASLDMKSGGEIAQNLFGLYSYMNKRLVEANLNNDPALLDEVTHLLAELQDAWATIRPQVVQPAAA
jgi:flagellar secretion chaperone FliS